MRDTRRQGVCRAQFRVIPKEVVNREPEGEGTAALKLNREWDAFLERSPLGQFQQSSGWARVKAHEGWQVHRVYADPQRPSEGGLQLLWKQSRFGRFGYISKGPVLPVETPAAVNAMMVTLKARAASLGLRAMILQPPDDSEISTETLIKHGFGRDPVEFVIRATAVVDVSGGRVPFMEHMGKKSRWEARQALKQGVTVRVGSRADLPLFFSLMLETCRRQRTQPNPSRLELIEALWDAFSPTVMVGFAVHAGKAVAGVLMIGHGHRMTIWKKGWNSQDSHLFANRLLNIEAFGWSCDRGYAAVDFVALDSQIAETLLSGGKLTEAQRSSRDIFHLRLGAQPKLLPPARLLVINPALRRLHRLLGLIPAVERGLMHRLGSI